MRDAELPKLLEVFDTILRASDDQDIQGIAAGIQGLETARMFDPQIFRTGDCLFIHHFLQNNCPEC
jgi:hypothetical protein